MTNRVLYMIIEGHAHSKEAEEIFTRRGWVHANDQTVPLPGKKQIRKTEHDTPQIKLHIEEWEYGVDEK